MAMDTTAPPAVDKAGNPGGPPAPRATRPWWLGPNLLYAFVGAAAGYAIGHMVGNWIAHTYQQVQGEGDNNHALVLGYLFATFGWLAGIGALNYPFQKLFGYAPATEAEGAHERKPTLRSYFSYTLDHKVVGVQYLVGMLVYFFVAGLFAMAIRSELLVAHAPHTPAGNVPRGRRRARHDDDDDDDVGHPRPVRQLPRPVDDRVASDGVPAT